jgi:ATP-binding cassette subfamily B protein RaxB
VIASLFAARHRLPIIVQAERSECGIACLAMIASYYGCRVNLNGLRQDFPVSARGASLSDILSVASALQLQTRALRLEPQELRKIALPAILHWDMGHFVVLKSISRNGVIIHDPAFGERKCSAKELDLHFTGIAIECIPGRDFVRESRAQTTVIWELFSRFPGFYAAVGQLFLLSLLIQLANIGAAFYLQLVIDESIAKHDTDLLVVLCVGFGLLMITNVAMSFARSTVQLYFANQLGFQMAGNVFAHLMKLPVDFFSKRHVGDLVSRVGSLGEIRNTLAEDMITVVLDGLFASLVLIVLFYFEASLATLVLVFVILLSLFKLSLVKPIKTLTERRIVAEAVTTTSLMENMRAIEIIKFYCRELERVWSWRNQYAEQVNATVQLTRFGIRIEAVYGLLAGLENLIVIYLAARYVLEGSISLGFMTAFLALKANFSASIRSLIDKIVQIRLLKLQLERVSDITCAKVEYANFYLPEVRSTLRGQLQLRALSYQYSGSVEPALRDVNLQIETGEIVAIVGPSGSGKSTLIKIMAGLVFPSEGSVEVDGQALQRMGIRHYRSACAGVLQSDQLLSGTLKENICLYDDVVDMPRMEHAAQLAGIKAFINSLPMGYNSLVGDMGSIMSAGQSQRILLARAFYKRAQILFLDEATANLDLEVEQQVLSAIQSLGVTTIMVTHREAPLKIADRVLSCEGGCVREWPDKSQATLV